VKLHLRKKVGYGEHEHPGSRKEKAATAKKKTGMSHVPQVEFCRGTREKQNGG